MSSLEYAQKMPKMTPNTLVKVIAGEYVGLFGNIRGKYVHWTPGVFSTETELSYIVQFQFPIIEDGWSCVLIPDSHLEIV